MTETLSDGICGPKDQDEQRRAFVLEMLAPGALDLNAYEVATKLKVIDRWLKTGNVPKEEKPTKNKPKIQLIQT